MTAREPQQKDQRQFVSFVVAGEEFGVNILTVQEIIRPMAITRVPHAPDFVEGIINLRGRIVPIIDLRKRFGFPPREKNQNTRIVVLEMGEQVVGFVTDAVREVLHVDASTIEPAPELAVGIDAHYLRGVAKLKDRLLILLDLEGVLSEAETRALEKLRRAASDEQATADARPRPEAALADPAA